MRRGCLGSFRISLFLWMVLIPGVFVSFSCSTEHSVSSGSQGITSSDEKNPDIDPVHKQISDSPVRNTAAVNENSSLKEKQAQISPVEELSRLWYSGQIEEARVRFSEGDIPINDEWHMWRGRLFIRRWSGSQLGLAGENISALLNDGDDLWAGTWTGGLIRYSVPLDSYTVWDPGLPSLAVRTVNRIIKDFNKIWVVRYSSLERYDKRTGEWTVEIGLPAAERIQDFCVIGNKYYLATLGHGLWVKEHRSWRRIDYPGLFINRLEYGDDGELLVATMDRGMYLLDTVTENWDRPPAGILQDANITSLKRSGDIIFGGTYGKGAFLWDTASSEVIILNKEQLGDSWVLAVVESGNKYYFGTFGSGINLLNRDSGKWDRIGLAEGIPSADIASLMKDAEDNIWAGTLGGGIIRISNEIIGD